MTSESDLLAKYVNTHNFLPAITDSSTTDIIQKVYIVYTENIQHIINTVVSGSVNHNVDCKQIVTCEYLYNSVFDMKLGLKAI